MFDFLVDGLAVWRVSRLLVREHGPFGLATRLREMTGIEHDADGTIAVWPMSTPLGCVLCTSVWVALLLPALPTFARRVLALSAITVLAERLVE